MDGAPLSRSASLARALRIVASFPLRFSRPWRVRDGRHGMPVRVRFAVGLALREKVPWRMITLGGKALSRPGKDWP